MSALASCVETAAFSPRTYTSFDQVRSAAEFARAEETCFRRAKPVSVVIEPRAGRPIKFHFQGADLPDWAMAVFESLEDRWGAPMGWDGYSARPTSPALATALLNCLQIAMPVGATPPAVMPLADGGLQAEWHRNGMTLEIVVASGEEPSYYFWDPATGQEAEGLFEESIDEIQAWVGRF